MQSKIDFYGAVIGAARICPACDRRYRGLRKGDKHAGDVRAPGLSESLVAAAIALSPSAVPLVRLYAEGVASDEVVTASGMSSLAESDARVTSCRRSFGLLHVFDTQAWLWLLWRMKHCLERVKSLTSRGQAWYEHQCAWINQACQIR